MILLRTILILHLVVLVHSVTMITYYNPGNYILTPEDYGYQSSIIFEMWSAGSGSSFKLHSSHEEGNNTFCGGNSGNYVKMNITTYGVTFNFTLGSGGNCTLNSYIASDGGNGGISAFYTNNGVVNITLMGAYSHKLVQSHPDKIIPNTYKYGVNDTMLFRENGLSLKCVNEEMLSYVPYGAPSYGAYGGQTYNPKYYEYYTHPNNCNGRMGSGTGYGCNLLKYNTLPAQYYKGGDGALILYY